MTKRPDLAEKRARVKADIRRAAIAEFAEFGLRGASTQGIADRAGISKTKLHYHINSKEDLYREVLDHILKIWSQLFEDIPMDLGPEAFLRTYIRRKVQFSIEHPEVVCLFTSEVMGGASRLKSQWQAGRQSTQRAADQIKIWIDKGLIRPVDPYLLQINIWALTERYALMRHEVAFIQGLNSHNDLNADQISDEIVALVLTGLRPDT